MKKPDFSSVYHNPTNYRDFITHARDDDFEGQHFDRKQIGNTAETYRVSKSVLSSTKEHIEKTMSGFANATGGLLVVGISKTGEIKGIDHLSDSQRTSLLSVDSLRGGAIRSKVQEISVGEESRHIALFMIEPNNRTFCCRIRDDAAWIRRGPSTVRLLGEELEQVKRDRKVVEFERAASEKFDISDSDEDVVREFIASNELRDNQSTNEVLYNAGAAVGRETELEWTNAGLLFFASNPQRILSHAYIRLLRFDCLFKDEDERPTPDLDRKFDGTLTQQIRSLRTFFADSAFFKTFERRSQDGGFQSEPEYPAVAVDEAVVNAIAHRDYGIGRPILCEKYNDSFIVRSPGSMQQPEELPSQFRLTEVQLESIPRNAKIMDWLRSMKDAKGSSYVKALREGTRKMRDEMSALGLPAPTYRLGPIDTVVVLENNVSSRAPQPTGLAGGHEIDSHEFTNLYPLEGIQGLSSREGEREERRILLEAICDKLEATGWVVDELRMGRAVVHVKGAREYVPDAVSSVLRVIPAYTINLRSYFGRYYLVVDFTVRVQTIWTASQAIERFGPDALVGLRAFSRIDGKLMRGRIQAAASDYITIRAFGDEDEYECIASNVFPSLRKDQIQEILKQVAPTFDLSRAVKSAALSTVQGAVRRRVDRINQCVRGIRRTIFPIVVQGRTVTLAGESLPLAREGDGKRALRVEEIREPEVEFGRRRASANIREGITRFGAYRDNPKDLDIVAVVEPGYDDLMRSLVERLQVGAYKFRGAERTFATRLRLSLVSTARGGSISDECKRLVDAYPGWCGDGELSRLMLVHTAESAFALDDVSSSYYRAKRVLLEAGIPCQMVDTPTLEDPNYKDLNLALNVVAKTGVTPWVLPESIPDADFFVGLSYTSSREAQQERVVGFANVFNQYGRWEFYSGGNEAVPYRERAAHYEQLVANTLMKLDLREHPTVYFHYSAKFGQREREAILQGARSVRPNGRYVFVWVNSHHPVRFFDQRAETDGSMARGRYVVGARNQIYLSTTGYNPYRKSIGTPQALEVNVYSTNDGEDAGKGLDFRALATQMLSLTKLNWASTDSLCGEPITIKYARNIAYLTAAFQRQKMGRFKLHEVLERTPWFI